MKYFVWQPSYQRISADILLELQQFGLVEKQHILNVCFVEISDVAKVVPFENFCLINELKYEPDIQFQLH